MRRFHLGVVSKFLSLFSGPTADGTSGQYLQTDGNRGVSFTTPPFSTNQMAGLTLSNDTDTDHDVNVTAGECRDSSNASDITLSSEQTKQIDASWATGNDAGGLSSSLTVANDTWYHVFAVLIGGTAEVIFDTSLTCANGVTDHTVTAYRRIGSVLTDGSANILAFVQHGRDIQWATVIADVSANPGTSADTVTISTPLGIQVIAHVGVKATSSTAADSTAGGTAFSTEITDVVATGSASMAYGSHAAGGGNSGHSATGHGNVITNTSSQIKVVTTSETDSFNLSTLGWEDIALAEGN